MEQAMVQNEESSGKITKHNTHLLDDDLGIMQDSLDGNRPLTSGTHSSEESRLLDGSPDRYEDAGSEGSIETEKQYQEDLKERVKRSFAELGLNPSEIQEDNERLISPRDSLEIESDVNIDKKTVENDYIMRDSIEDFDEHRYKATESALSKRTDKLEKQEQFVHQNNNNSGGNIDGENDDDEYESAYLNNTSIPVNDDLQLRTNSNNNLEKTAEIKKSYDHESTGNHHLNSRAISAEKTYRISPVNSPLRVNPSRRNLDVISPENKTPKYSDPATKIVEKNNSGRDLIETLPGGEKVRVEYISDDSGDDDEHYVDEKGSPIHFDDAREKARQQVYKIKPRPPDTPIDSSKQSSKLRRYSLERRETPTKQEKHNAAIVSIQKVTNADVDSLGKFENNEACNKAYDTGTANTEGTIPNLEQTSRDVGASSQKQFERKVVDAEVYAKLQLKSQEKIKSREASANRQSTKGSVRVQKTSSRHLSKKTSKERSGSNKITQQPSKLVDKENIQLSVERPVQHRHDKQKSKSNTVEDRLQYERENERFSSKNQEILEPAKKIVVEDDHDSQQQSYQYQTDRLAGNEQQSDLPFDEPDNQQNLNPSYGEEHANIYRRPGQNLQYPTHPIQPAYQPLPLQQQAQYSQYQGQPYYSHGSVPYQGPSQPLQYSQGSVPYQGPSQPLQYSQDSVPYPGALQPNQTQYSGPQPYVQPEPVQYQNESRIYQAHQFPIQTYSQYQVPYHNHQNVVNYQPNYPGNQVRNNINQGQPQPLNQVNPTFNQHGHLAGSAPHGQPFYNQQPQHLQYQPQPISQPHTHGFQGSSQPLYETQIQQYERPVNFSNEEIPPLDLRGIVEDYPQVQQQSPQAHQVSKNSNKKTDKSKINFIEHNKVKLRKELPERGYLDRYKQEINPRKPLPSISRANSEDSYCEHWPEDGNYEKTWTTDPGTNKSRYNQLPRQQSDTAVHYSNTNLRNVMSPEESSNNYPQSAPVNFHMRTDFQNPDDLSSSPTWPQFTTGGSHIKFSSFSADHATSYARMQYKPKVLSKLENSPRLSTQRPGPYPVLPNIEGTDMDELRKSDPDGYLAKMQKARQEPQYKKYTLKDYQKLKVDTKLGGLGPDIDSAQEKQEKVMRQREYAKQVMMKNRKAFQQSKTLGWLPPEETPQEKGPTKRDKAIEYSKKVPKPRLPTPPEEKHERIYCASSRGNNMDNESELKQLEQLRLRHEKEKEEVAKIKNEIKT